MTDKFLTGVASRWNNNRRKKGNVYKIQTVVMNKHKCTWYCSTLIVLELLQEYGIDQEARI